MAIGIWNDFSVFSEHPSIDACAIAKEKFDTKMAKFGNNPLRQSNRPRTVSLLTEIWIENMKIINPPINFLNTINVQSRKMDAVL